MLGIITGLAAEARLARPLGMAMAGGGTEAGAGRAAEALVARGATSLISFGLAGGLDPALPPGALVIPARVIGEGGVFQADSELVATLGGPTVDSLLAVAAIVASAADKARLHATRKAAAVDMESGAVAAVAAAHGLRFAVLRAVCDPARRDLPPAALAALDSGGNIAILRVMAAVLRQPMQMPALLALARDARSARNTLRRHVLAVASAAATSSL